MPSLKSLLNPAAYLRFARRHLEARRLRANPSLRGVTMYPPGHFYSPLLDLSALRPEDNFLPHDGPEYWECVDLRPAEQRAYYADLLTRFPPLPFPFDKAPSHRYYTGNNWFPVSDAFTLSGVIRKERPARIVEIGSGFSSAVMLDTLNAIGISATLTFIDPYPDRLQSLLSPRDTATVIAERVQDCPLSVFDTLEANDILAIDSSHVAKVGSDVTLLFLRVLPRLKPGVVIHVHDIFYPHSYPIGWIREGRAWNESLFLRAFLTGNPQFQVMAFNSFAAATFPDLFQHAFPTFLENAGGSIWLRKVS